MTQQTHTGFDFSAALSKSRAGKLGKRAAKLGYGYVIRGRVHVLKHKNGERHFDNIDEVERFVENEA